MLSSLDRKLLRDLLARRGQAIAIVLIVACGIASLVTMRSTYHSLVLSQSRYYNEYRFAEVFVQLQRAPEALLATLRQVSGVAQVRSRVVETVTLDVPGLADPATGRLVSIPEQPQPMLNDLVLRSGRYLEPGRLDEVIASEAFVQANRLQLGDRLNAVLSRLGYQGGQPFRVIGGSRS